MVLDVWAVDQRLVVGHQQLVAEWPIHTGQPGCPEGLSGTGRQRDNPLTHTDHPGLQQRHTSMHCIPITSASQAVRSSLAFSFSMEARMGSLRHIFERAFSSPPKEACRID